MDFLKMKLILYLWIFETNLYDFVIYLQNILLNQRLKFLKQYGIISNLVVQEYG